MDAELILVAIAAISLIAMLVLVVARARDAGEERAEPSPPKPEPPKPSDTPKPEPPKPSDTPKPEPPKPSDTPKRSVPPQETTPQARPAAPPLDAPEPESAPRELASKSPSRAEPSLPPARPHGSEGEYAFVAPTPRRQRSSKRSPSVPAPSDAPPRDLLMRASREAAAVAKQVDIVGGAAPPARFDRIEQRQAWWGDLPLELSTGLEAQPVELGLLGDAAVRATRAGPTIESLNELVAGQPCDLGNIEVFYRLGLSHLARGQYGQAHEYFASVEEVSPGYRAADARARAVRQWLAAVGDELTGAPDATRSSQFELLGELGRGATAVVYHARDTVADRAMALKIMSRELSSHHAWCEHMLRDARRAASVDHPGVVRVYDCGLFQGRVFIGMEVVDGSPVDDLSEQLTIVESLRIAVKALEALDYAHEREVLHQDVKPSNLMRTRDGEVKVVDFGLAQPLDTRGDVTIAGTPAFMAPEQLAGEPLDRRADIFAMGVTLYQMLTRELPYPGRERSKPPRAPQELVPAIPDQVDAAIMQAIALDRDQRWESANAFAAALRRALGAVGRFASKPPLTR